MGAGKLLSADNFLPLGNIPRSVPTVLLNSLGTTYTYSYFICVFFSATLLVKKFLSYNRSAVTLGVTE